MATSPQFIATPKMALRNLVQGDGTSTYTLFTMGSNGGIVESIFLSSSDNASKQIDIIVNNGVSDATIDRVTIPAATTGVPVVQINILNPSRWTWLDLNNVRWVMPATSALKVRMVTAVTATFTVSVLANYGEF